MLFSLQTRLCCFGINASHVSPVELEEQTNDDNVIDADEELGLPDNEIEIIEHKKARKRRKIEGVSTYLVVIPH